MRSSLREWLLFSLLLLLAVPSRASVFGPGHAVWKNPQIEQAEFARALLELRNRQLKEASHLRLEQSAVNGRKTALSGERRFLVIPVLYADGPQEGPVSQEEISARFFDESRESSFVSYWKEVSGGRLVARGRVLPWLRMPQVRSYYQNVFQGRPRLVASRRLAEDAICAAAPILGPWWDFDDDGPDGIPGSGDDDGLLDFVIILHPDPGIEIQVEEEGMMALQDRVDTQYVLSSCQVGADPFAIASALDPLGVIVHEAGHLFGLVDLYDLNVPADQSGDGYATGGLGRFSLMATGTWAGGGKSPTGLDAYSRSLLGWGEAQQVGFTLQALLDPGSAPGDYLVLSPEGDWKRERFLVEARAAGISPRDEALPGQGILIYRVDEAARGCSGTDFPLVELLEADGRQDLIQGLNQGEASDFYGDASGNYELGPSSTPSSQSRTPSPAKPAPRIRIQDAGAQRWTLQLEKSAVAGLSLKEARFADGPVQLAPGSAKAWQLLFLPTSLSPILSARLRVLSVDAPLSASTMDWISLEPGQEGYAPTQDIILQVPAQPGVLDTQLRLEVEVNGQSRQIEGGIPLQASTGLRAEDFARWTAEVVSEGIPATIFDALSESETPTAGLSGFRLHTAQDYAYGNCCELQLLSPWIASSAAPDTLLRFWSRIHSEASLPPEAWDGGVVECRSLGGQWTPLALSGPSTGLIVPMSRAATSGIEGVGGESASWVQLKAELPARDLPLQLRFRFGSDADGLIRDPAGGWSLAGASVGEAGWQARLDLLSAGEQAQARLSVLPPPDSLRASLWGRVLPEEGWQLLAPAQLLDANGETLFHFSMPQGAVVQLGAFVGESTATRLAVTGRRSGGQAFSVRPNPAFSFVNFLAEASAEERTLLIYDRRGRELRRLPFPANLGLVSWDGTDDAGHRLASGLYLARLLPSRYKAISVTIIH
ncbi:MAG TPA: immune inhibitor A domain-containing protein [Candidatus Krumholzibacteria bacterium]|nr:immune inhibitor A domain-containing protein [Candidatus Krumholzibacteria bacterium]